MLKIESSPFAARTATDRVAVVLPFCLQAGDGKSLENIASVPVLYGILQRRILTAEFHTFGQPRSPAT
jgi:hypothetical protein